MTVRELLARIDARELAEWEAYERVSGHLGSEWDRHVLRDIHHLLQAINVNLLGLRGNRDLSEPDTVPPPWEE